MVETDLSTGLLAIFMWLLPGIICAIICYYIGKYIGRTTDANYGLSFYFIALVVLIVGGMILQALYFKDVEDSPFHPFPYLMALFFFVAPYCYGFEKTAGPRGITE